MRVQGQPVALLNEPCTFTGGSRGLIRRDERRKVDPLEVGNITGRETSLLRREEEEESRNGAPPCSVGLSHYFGTVIQSARAPEREISKYTRVATVFIRVCVCGECGHRRL